MNYLIDTNVLSEPRCKKPDPRVVAWLQTNTSHIYTSVLVLGEIRYGIEILPANSARKAEMLKWHKELVGVLAGRVLSINARVVEEWAKLQAETYLKRRVLPVIDSLLAATARRYQLTLATDNVKDFVDIGLKLFNPFDQDKADQV